MHAGKVNFVLSYTYACNYNNFLIALYCINIIISNNNINIIE